MNYGMTYEQFWEGDPWMVKAFAEAYIMRRKVENENAWIYGAYVLDAVSVSLANMFGKRREEYHRKPLDIFPKTEMEKAAEVREEKQRVIAYLSKLKKSKKVNK